MRLFVRQVQGYLTHKKPPLLGLYCRTIWGRMVALGGGAGFDERGTPVVLSWPGADHSSSSQHRRTPESGLNAMYE